MSNIYPFRDTWAVLASSPASRWGGLVGIIIIIIIMHPSSFVIWGHLTCNLSMGGSLLVNFKKIKKCFKFLH
jgi:hypothetical protein